MVRNYIRKTEAPKWSKDDIIKALKDINDGVLSMRKASRHYKIPLTTLQRKFIENKNGSEPQSPKQGRYRQVFSADEEQILCQHLLEMQRQFYGLTAYDVRQLAFEVAEILQIEHPFNKEMRLAGADWLAQFMKRQEVISLRKPEPTSIARVKGMNRTAVDRFFHIMREVYAEHQFEPQNIYNIDEFGINVVHKPQKIIALKGEKQVGRAVSGERGKNVTLCCGISSTGMYVPPFFIFYQAKMNRAFMTGKAPGMVGVANGSGWMDCPTFLLYIDHFIRHTKPTRNDPVLIVLDGHCSHKSIEVIKKCRENFITLVSLPPHTTNHIQPLDLTVFGPIRKAYERECDDFTRKERLKTISIFDIVGLFTKAFLKKAKPSSAIRGFEVAGIFPFDPEIFEDNYFYEEGNESNDENGTEALLDDDAADDPDDPDPVDPAVIRDELDPPLIPDEHDTESNRNDTVFNQDTSDCSRKTVTTSATTSILPNNAVEIIQPVPSTSKDYDPKISVIFEAPEGIPSAPRPPHKTPQKRSLKQQIEPPSVENDKMTFSQKIKKRRKQLTLLYSKNPESSELMQFKTTVKKLSPTQPESKPIKKTNRKKEVAEKLTSSPYLQQLEEKKRLREEKEKAREEKAKLREQKGATVRQKLFKPEQPKTKSKAKVSSKKNIKPSADEEENDECRCIYCCDLYSNSASKEVWIQCHDCKQWAHSGCTEYDDNLKITKIFTCLFCVTKSVTKEL